MKKYTILILFIFLSASVHAKITYVSKASDISSSLWSPGDTIMMKNGVWLNQSIIFTATGSADQPVVLLAETPGEVILTGTSSLSFSGKHIEINGLYFKDGSLSGMNVISFRTSSSNLAENCRLTNTAIVDYNPADKTKDNKWISLYGKNNRVDHCTFINKTNSGTLLVVWLTSGIIPNHVIESNYFGYRNANLDANGNEINGQEIIRIGDSNTSMQTAGVVVSNNFFEHCNGEIEIISNKSCENIYSNNVFFECIGTLTLRHGNRCIVEGNYFFGNNISRTGGVRIIGEGHAVYNNYFENLTGTDYRAAIGIIRGKENSALNEYFQVKNAQVLFNTIVNCKQALSVNYNSSSSLTLPPIGTTIAHNHVYNTGTSNKNVTIYQVNVAAMDVIWKNNLMNKGTYSGFSYDPTQVKTGIDPSMEIVTTSIPIYEPAINSLLSNYHTDEYPAIETDLRGRLRGSEKNPGASQITGVSTREMPTKETTGTSFYSDPLGHIDVQVEPSELIAYWTGCELVTRVSVSGTLSVFDISGICIHQQKIYPGLNSTSIQKKGIYLLRFYGIDGGLTTQKVVCH